MPLERAARDDLILANASWARNVALSVVRRVRLQMDRQEAVAAALGALVEAAERFRPGGAARFQTFAYPGVRGAVIDRARADSIETGRSDAGRREWGAREFALDDVPPSELTDAKPDPLAATLALRDAQALAELLEYALPREREALRLAYLREMPLVDVGRALGVSESRACQLVHAGIKRIRAGRLAARMRRAG